MSMQLHRKIKKEQAKKRRKYLLQKTISGASIFFWIALAVACLFVGARFAGNGFDPPFLSFALIGLFGIYYCSRSIAKTKSLPYVAPVSEQIADMSAEEVLLRGSDQPASTPSELLRAAHAGTETDVAGLLHASQEPIQQRNLVKVTGLSIQQESEQQYEQTVKAESPQTASNFGECDEPDTMSEGEVSRHFRGDGIPVEQAEHLFLYRGSRG